MPYLIGTDEAGYGPNLGPLVIAATAWRVPESLGADADLYDVLSDCVTRDARDHQRLAIADSKALYHSGDALDALERGVLAGISICGQRPSTWRELWRQLDADCLPAFDREPWNRDFDEPLPLALSPGEIENATSRFGAGLQRVGIELRAIRCQIAFPFRFNELVARLGNKSEVLSRLTLDLARSLLPADELGDEPSDTLIHCDKHGGRNKYVPMLQPLFPETLIEVFRESRDLSIYRWGAKSRRMEIRFAAKGESFLPSALASMVAKYTRELAMRSFNAFWRREVPGLKPTAGYPVDALRFQKEVATRRGELAIPDEVFWRCR